MPFAEGLGEIFLFGDYILSNKLLGGNYFEAKLSTQLKAQNGSTNCSSEHHFV